MKHQLTTLVLGEVSKTMRGEIFEPQMVKNAPHYFETSVPRQIILGEEKGKIDGKEVVFQLKGYAPDILVIQTNVPVKDIFKSEILNLESKIFEACEKLLKRFGGNIEWSETYSVFSVSDYKDNPERFFKHSQVMASLLKSERLELDPKEIEYTLSAQIKYAKNDLAIIDWDGAFLFDPEGDVEPTVELLTLANLQLLRHRILDRELDERLEKMGRLVRKPSIKTFFIFKSKEVAEDIKEIIKNRMASIADFQVLERDIKLIGDWYSARLYDLTAKKFKISDWRASIKDKLKSLEDIYGMVVENFGVSSKERVEWVQIIAFFILQIGWFALIILEFFYFTK